MGARNVRIDSVQKSFGNETVLRDITLEVESGAFCVVMGPSGCGKTTLLNCVAGLVDVERGQIQFDGRDVTDQPVAERDLGYVFQEFEDTLFPHKTVAENIAFGLRQQQSEVSEPEIEDRVDEMLALFNIEATRGNTPGELSGGQQQRVELARQLVCERDLLLLDDPLADLDYKLQKRMEIEIRRLHEDLGSTFLYVTHNQDQALKLADRLIVMNEGQIEQIGSPAEVYNSPESAFVARFVGDSNALAASVRNADDRSVTVDTELGEITAEPRGPVTEETGVVLIRPKRITIGDEAYDRENTIEMTYQGSTYTGEVVEHAVLPDSLTREFLIDETDRDYGSDPGERVPVGWDAADAQYFETLSAADSVTVEDIIQT
ncbi:ABC transporter ATP-binding protein [Haloarcula litorea]|uniref:ABC transporter ATP-binding protein n=1 Tax=Haloarcula litorea TaxID=3032579 RepID=UPI0023E7FC8A|nr:ABC transporter ATP-binding protein [Halomicroarcula sp. GDY20]